MEVEILGLIIYDWCSILQISPREMLLPICKNFLPQKFLIIISNNLKMSVLAFQAAHMMSHDAQLMLDQFVLLHGS